MKTQAQLDHAASQRLQRTYGRDLAWYEQQFELQGFGCAVCKDGPKTRRLHVDHDHHWVDIKIATQKVAQGFWKGEAHYHDLPFMAEGRTKSEVFQKIKKGLKEASVRGLLCHRCNRAMILFKDQIEIIRKAADYLERFKGAV